MIDFSHERFIQAFNGGNLKEAERLARTAFSSTQIPEHVLAHAAALLYQGNVSSSFDLLQVFVERFPGSHHPLRVFLADVLCRQDQFDQATDHARIYLRILKDSEVLTDPKANPIVREGASRAFLLLTAAYTELGARGYSRRVLASALTLPLSDRWHGIMMQEQNRLRDECGSGEAKSMNETWEEFFSSGAGADAIHELCKSRGYSAMAKRVDLIESNFRFNPEFKVTTDEIFAIVQVAARGGFVLQ